MSNETSAGVGSDVAPRRSRPRERKAQILAAAALAFSERGYYPVGVNDIAAELGISGAALYRHFPSKYALLVATAEAGPRLLLSAAEAADSPKPGPAVPPAQRLDAVIRALIGVTADNRRRGGLYRWEGRYLEQADRARVRGIFEEVNRRVAAPLHDLRPHLSRLDTVTLAAAALSVIASITAHRTVLATGRMTDLLGEACSAVVRCELPVPPAGPAVAAEVGHPPAAADKRALLIDAAVRTFGRRGYHEAGLDEIATAAGMNASGVYRHFSSKADLLAAALYRAGDRLTVATADAVSASTGPQEALLRLADRYVELAFDNPALLEVYFAEFGNLPDAERARLRTVQRGHVRDWAQLLTAVRPDAAAAQFRVHAALGLVLDIGRLTHFDARPQNRARIHQLMRSVLLGVSSATDNTRSKDGRR